MSNLLEIVGGGIPNRLLPVAFSVLIISSSIYGLLVWDSQKALNLHIDMTTTYITTPKVEKIFDKQPLIEKYLMTPFVEKVLNQYY